MLTAPEALAHMDAIDRVQDWKDAHPSRNTYLNVYNYNTWVVVLVGEKGTVEVEADRPGLEAPMMDKTIDAALAKAAEKGI